MNILSAVVKTRREDLRGVEEALKTLGWCEVHFVDEHGKIVVTFECDDQKGAMEKMRAIERVAKVVSAELAYAYIGDVDD
ncbi:MAG: chaperone NapD [Nitrospirae bacterium]|nr:chaperone NapD [Nitrospirota bacterium]